MGTVKIFGKTFDEVRQLTGVCLQHDVLFDLLTPLEHLDILYDFKCKDRDPFKKKEEIERLVYGLEIENLQAGKLSRSN